jgi:CheY-like chemotaxis protein
MTDVTPILLIEDDANLARATTRWLRRAFPDAFVAHAYTADQATLLVTTNPGAWCLVVADYDLGAGGTGGDVLRFVREHAPDLAPHFVFFSASPEAQEIAPTIVKPTTFEIFAAGVADHVRPRLATMGAAGAARAPSSADDLRRAALAWARADREASDRDAALEASVVGSDERVPILAAWRAAGEVEAAALEEFHEAARRLLDATETSTRSDG